MTALAGTRARLGFSGLGWIGRSRLDALVEDGLVEVAAVADPRVPGCLRTFEALLEEELDGVVIASPNALHAEQAIAALERGLAVFCQKPLGRTAAETRVVVEAARGADRLLAVDLSYRCSKSVRAVRDLVRSGALGEVVAASLVFHNAYGPEPDWYYDRRLSGGGCVLDLGIHLIDLALWTLDFPPALIRSARLLSPRGSDVEELALVQLELGSVVATLACSWRLHAGKDAVIEASFYGTAGGASVSNVNGSFYDLRADGFHGTAAEPLAAPPDDWGGRAAVDWARRVVAGERFDPEAERLVSLAEILDAIYDEASCAS